MVHHRPQQEQVKAATTRRSDRGCPSATAAADRTKRVAAAGTHDVASASLVSASHARLRAILRPTRRLRRLTLLGLRRARRQLRVRAQPVH
eukprot:1430026-Prymnesium_polylepis.1